MNVVLDDAEEVDVKTKTKKPIGRILLKGDTITLMQTAPAVLEAAGDDAKAEEAKD